jgi:two-component sensor histidine kinase
MGQHVSDVIGQSVEQVWPDLAAQVESTRGKPVPSSEITLGQGDLRRTFDAHVSPLSDWRGHMVSHVVVLREITERKRAEEQIKASLKEKEVLLREIHHRVKNNLQVICSLLSLQADHIKDRRAAEVFRDGQSRIRSMGLVHEALYRSQDLARIDFAAYIQSLVSNLFHSYNTDSTKIRLTTDVSDVSLSVNTAIPCGLIINELVSNSLKHAFPDGRQGDIHVALALDGDGRFTLMVSDNGIGYPDGMDFLNASSLGLQLVTTLAQQLEGTMDIGGSDGAVFKITFCESG